MCDHEYPDHDRNGWYCADCMQPLNENHQSVVGYLESGISLRADQAAERRQMGIFD